VNGIPPYSVPLLPRWSGGLEGQRQFVGMVHFSDWFPTILSMEEISKPSDLQIDGLNILPAIQGERGKDCTKRFGQWNRYTQLVTSMQQYGMVTRS
jgi:arylsulfatase A-like enzyme